MMRSPHTHTAGEVSGPPSVAETGWGDSKAVTSEGGSNKRESAGHGYGDNRRLPMWLDAWKKQGLLPEGGKAKI